MPIPQLDHARCLARNLRESRRGIHAVPLKFGALPITDLAEESRPGSVVVGTLPARVSARGTIPATPVASLARINDLLPAGVEPLDEKRVHLLPIIEAGNTNLIDDRWMFLGLSTLRNVAAAGDDGFSVMNSHRTGDISTPAELPYGRTFAGRYESIIDDNGKRARVLLGAYMLRGQAPNGASGPTTDTLAEGINGGTIFDVSLGLYGGVPVCDVCGEDLETDWDTGGTVCGHIPGTHENMSASEIESQEARGVPDGLATFTLEGAGPREVSPVYDGAVPGAGFVKARTMALAGKISARGATQLLSAFGPFWTPRDRHALATLAGTSVPTQRRNRVMSRITLQQALTQLGVREEQVQNLLEGHDVMATPMTPPPAIAPLPPPMPHNGTAAVTLNPSQPVPDPHAAELLARVAALQTELAASRADNAATRQATALAQEEARLERAVVTIGTLLRTETDAGRLTPAEQDHWSKVLLQAANDDHRYPVEGGSRFAQVQAAFAARPSHGLLGGRLSVGPPPAGSYAVQNNPHLDRNATPGPTPAGQVPTPERANIERLMALTPDGAATLARIKQLAAGGALPTIGTAIQ